MNLSKVLNEVCWYHNFPCYWLKNRQLLFRLLWQQQQQQRKLDHYNDANYYIILYTYSSFDYEVY